MSSYLPIPKSKQPKAQKIPGRTREPEPSPVSGHPAPVPPLPGRPRGLPEEELIEAEFDLASSVETGLEAFRAAPSEETAQPFLRRLRDAGHILEMLG